MESQGFKDMIEKDFELLWFLHDYCNENPWLEYIMQRIVSKQPWQDICFLNWILYGIGIMELGRTHFWVGATNLGFAFVLRKLISAKRPVEYDLRCQPLADINAESYGFPSLESYMSVVITGHLFFSFKTLWLLPVAVIVPVVMGFSRVYARSRFPHQIVASWMLGFVGLLISMHCCQKAELHKLSHHDHGVCVAFVAACGLAHLALCIENNDSRLLYIPKKEFVRVIAGIVNGSAPNTTTTLSSSSSAPLAAHEGDDGALTGAAVQRSKAVNATPRSAAAKRAAELAAQMLKRRGGEVKHDSFYFLQKTMEERSRVLHSQAGSFQTGLTPRNARSPRDSDNERYYNMNT